MKKLKVPTISELAQKIAKYEGKKKEINIAQIKEIIGVISDIIQSERGEFGMSASMTLLLNNGERRLTKLSKKKKIEEEE